MDEFLLLVRSSYPATRVLSSAQLQLWQQWIDQLKADGSLVALPTHFDETGRILLTGLPVAAGPYVEGEEAIAGLLHIRAPDYEAAARIAQGCPVLAAGGTIEVRQVL